MIEFAPTMPNGTVTMNDLMVTFGVGVGLVVAWRQRQKDQQLKSRDETIEFLKTQITYLQEQLKNKGDGK